MASVQIKHRWTDALLYECDVPDTVESGLAMRHALEKATSSGADLRGANLRGANLSDANLRGANLSDADLRGADLRGADLRGADLRGAYFSDADLRDADLRGADLRGANLSDADLRGAYFSDADLRDANFDIAPATPEQAIENLDKVREIVLDNAERLDMGLWHGDDAWTQRSCVEETLCGTTHCLAGWLQVCSTDPKIRDLGSAQLAGMLAAPVASQLFFTNSATVIPWLRDRKYAEAA